MYKVLVLLILSLGFHESFQTCSYLQSCTQHLKAFINSTIQSHDISTKISLCLNVVDKQGKLQLCENDAVGKCQLAGHEPEYISYTKQKYEAKKECLKECPKMDEVKICQGEIDYNIIQSSGYSQFCSHYNNLQTTCVDTKLASCSFRSLLFQSGLSEDGKRIVQTICQSGCATIDNTTDAIKSCSRQYSLTPGDDKLLDCSFYDEYISCIQRESPCKEFKRVAEYSQRDISKAREKCESTSSSVAPSTMPTTSTTIRRNAITYTDKMTATGSKLTIVKVFTRNEHIGLTTRNKDFPSDSSKRTEKITTRFSSKIGAITVSAKTGVTHSYKTEYTHFLTTKHHGEFTVRKQGASSVVMENNFSSRGITKQVITQRRTETYPSRDAPGISNTLVTNTMSTRTPQRNPQTNGSMKIIPNILMVTYFFVLLSTLFM